MGTFFLHQLFFKFMRNLRKAFAMAIINYVKFLHSLEIWMNVFEVEFQWLWHREWVDHCKCSIRRAVVAAFCTEGLLASWRLLLMTVVPKRLVDVDDDGPH